MAETNRNEWVKNFESSINGASPQNSVDNNGDSSATVDKYDNLKNISYKEMLSSKVQAAAAKEQAQKYIGTSLNANGFGGQGIAESSRLGIFNNFNKAINEADATHQQNLKDIELQKANDLEMKGNDRWQSAMEMMQQAQSKSDLDYIKNNFYEGFSEDQKKYFNYYYASYNAQMPDQSVNLGSAYKYSKDENVYAYDRQTDGSVTVKDKFNAENDTLNSALAKGEIAKGSYIELANKSGQAIYIYYDKNGQLYYINKRDYDNQTENKFYIYGTDNKIYNGSYQG